MRKMAVDMHPDKRTSRNKFFIAFLCNLCAPPGPLRWVWSLRPSELASDDVALDLARALIDLQHFGVAEQFFNGVLGTVAHPPENLNRLGRGPHRIVGCESL